MNDPIVIAPVYHMAEYLCRQILNINPRKHAMGAQSAARHGLVGWDKPVVILYLADQHNLWKDWEFDEIEKHLEICQATVIRMPEVQRIYR